MAREPQRITGLCWVVHVNITVVREKHRLLLNHTKRLSLYLWPTPSVLLADLPNAVFPLASTHPFGIYWSLYVHTHLSYVYKCWSACPGIWGCCWLHLFREEQEETVKYPQQASASLAACRRQDTLTLHDVLLVLENNSYWKIATLNH